MEWKQKVYTNIRATMEEQHISYKQEDKDYDTINSGSSVFWIITISFNENTKIRFKINKHCEELISSIIVNGEEFEFNLRDKEKYEISRVHVQKGFNSFADIDNFLNSLQIKMGYRDKNYKENPNKTFRIHP